MPEATFRAFSATTGAGYAHGRGDYNPRLYADILAFHAATAGRFDALIDVGCGPGTAARALAPRFQHAVGLDPSPGMIAAACEIGGTTAAATAEAIRFEVSTAESVDAVVARALAGRPADLLIAAAAAHYFDMQAFWPAAARAVAPCGSVAIFTNCGIRADPRMPGSVAAQAALDTLGAHLRPFSSPAHNLVRGLYADLPMPWDVDSATDLGFDRGSVVRKVWGGDDGDGAEQQVNYLLHDGPQRLLSMDALETQLGTTSPVVRWREAHPADAGTERDVVKIARGQIERALRDVGAAEGQEVFQRADKGVLIMFKKRA
ncbi:hypothetical protein HK405_003454 [Cladochytrium tenue]|nr:hypothetical protein HK405_003454 [Cladochytrium tenue]